MPILQEPYQIGRLFVFVVNPRIRRAALITFIVLLVGALLRAKVTGGDISVVLETGTWMFLCAFLFSPLWNRFIVYPWAKKRVRKDRIGFLAFFELFPLGAALWVMLASCLWGVGV